MKLLKLCHNRLSVLFRGEKKILALIQTSTHWWCFLLWNKRPFVFHCLHSYSILSIQDISPLFNLSCMEIIRNKALSSKQLDWKSISMFTVFRNISKVMGEPCDVMYLHLLHVDRVWSLIKYFIWLTIKPFACRARVSGPVNKSHLLLWHWKIL